MRFDFRDSLGQRRTSFGGRIGGGQCDERSRCYGRRRSVSRELEQIIDLKHELVQLAGKIVRNWIDREIAPLYSDKGRPGIETRFMIGLLMLKHIYGLSDNDISVSFRANEDACLESRGHNERKPKRRSRLAQI